MRCQICDGTDFEPVPVGGLQSAFDEAGRRIYKCVDCDNRQTEQFTTQTDTS